MPPVHVGSKHSPRSPARQSQSAGMDAVSYEDLLVAQYLDDLKKERAASQKKRLTKSPKNHSPYLQRLAHSDAVGTAAGDTRGRLRPASGRRPFSAAQSTSRSERERKRIDARFVINGSKQNGVLEEEGEERSERRGKLRPVSAPVYKSRPWSGRSAASSISTFSQNSKVKVQYKVKPQVIRAVCFRNGSREKSVKITAPTMKIFLEYCTIKLDFEFAARRIFLEDGTEVKTAEEIPKDGELYISGGEPFKNPFKPVQGIVKKHMQAAWTLEGVVLPSNKKKTRTTLSKRMRNMLSTGMRRVMVFINGDAAESHEVVANVDQFNRFLDSCTAKLNLNSPARYIFTWDGQKLEDLNELPKLDTCLQSSTTPIYGPVWVSKGERFSALGAKTFLTEIVKICKQQLKMSRVRLGELQQAKQAAEERGNVGEAGVMEKEAKQVEDVIEEFHEARSQIEDILEGIRDKAAVEMEEGHTFKAKHMKEFDSSHRLVGQQGLKLKVYENGRNEGEETVFFNLKEASKGVQGDGNLLMQRLLDTITRWVRPEQNTTALSTIVTKIFDSKGKEITNVHDLKNDQKVWLSFGEPYRDPSVYCLQLTLDRAVGYKDYSQAYGEPQKVILREPLLGDQLPEGGDKHASWVVKDAYPEEAFGEINEDTPLEVREKVKEDRKSHDLHSDAHFLQHEDDESLMLYPEISVQEKQKSAKVWPLRGQSWCINTDGQIYCKAHPRLALTLMLNRGPEWEVPVKFPGTSNEMFGLPVCLLEREDGVFEQQWVFLNDGRIANRYNQDLLLTFVEPADQDEDPSMEMTPGGGGGGGGVSANDWLGSNQTNQWEDAGNLEDGEEVTEVKPEFKGHKFVLLGMERLSDRHKWAKSQRWALKQENLDRPREWRHNDLMACNPAWNKLAYSWPVDWRGDLNKNFDWPMEGYFIAYAPPIRIKSSVGALEDTNTEVYRTVPLRLRVMKNGAKDLNRVAFVVGPDLTNMMKDIHRTAQNGKRPHRHRRSGSKNKEDFEAKLQSKKGNLKQLEFQLFLDRCTPLLNLPFAARRLFDENGKELQTLDSLERDQLVYASSGDAWVNPKLSTQQQQRRLLLASLAGDVEAIKMFCTLRDPGAVCLEVSGALGAGSPLIVNTCCLSDDDREKLARGPTPEATPETPPPEGDPYVNMSPHQKAHMISDQRQEGLKWPWEKVLNIGLDEVSEANNQSGGEADGYTNPDLYHKLKPKAKSPRPINSRQSHQRFIYMDGYIACKTSPYLVLGPLDPSTDGSPMVICKKDADNAYLRWNVGEDGLIRCRANEDLVLTCTLPNATPGDGAPPAGLPGQSVSLLPVRSEVNGRANQIWALEKETGFIFGMAAEFRDREITAANRANVCTFAIADSEAIEQPGYTMKSGDGEESMTVCLACARTLRAQYRLDKLPKPTAFSCAVGAAQKEGQKIKGCLQFLGGKVDLSAFEATNTMAHYEGELKRLRQMTSARVIAREISAYQSVHTVRIVAYKNGDGRTQPGVIVCGSTLRGLLDQCTYSLQLPMAGRRLYAQDGTAFLTLADLHTWKMACFGMQNLDLGPDTVADGKDEGKTKRAITENIKYELVNRQPVEVWVSQGEPFKPPEQVDYARALKAELREERAKVMLELEKEKHVLRQMQGRRTAGLDGPEYVPTLSPNEPVLVEGGWTKPSVTEVKKSIQVNQLENHLSEVKAHQKSREQNTTTKPIVDSSRKLYSQPIKKRVMVYKNGTSQDKAQYVWGSTLEEILKEATVKLGLHRTATQLYQTTGATIETFEDVGRDEVLCVSNKAEAFKGSKGSRNQVEVKAEWSRARKRDGESATDIMVTANTHPNIEVDPFGPPMLALPAPGDK